MKTLKGFAAALAALGLTAVESAIALLWYHRETQQFEERSAKELADDLHDCGFPRPNVTRLAEALSRSRKTIRGKRKGTFQIDQRASAGLAETYAKLLGVVTVPDQGSVVPADIIAGTRPYLEKLGHQLNVSYDSGLYDCGA